MVQLVIQHFYISLIKLDHIRNVNSFNLFELIDSKYTIHKII